MRMMPNEKVKSAYDIEYEKLYAKGYRGIIFDIDNTLVPNEAPADDRAIALFKRLHQIGFRTMLLSNNRSRKRVEKFKEDVKASYCLWGANKPVKLGYRAGMQMLGTDQSSTVFIGDQIFTDMMGGLQAGMYTILTSPIDKTSDDITIKLKRRLESPIRHILNSLMKPS